MIASLGIILKLETRRQLIAGGVGDLRMLENKNVNSEHPIEDVSDCEEDEFLGGPPV